MAGLFLDPWQQLVLRAALAEDDRGKWAAFEAALVVSRQNGKGAILEALELAWLFLFGFKTIIHSAHEFSTAMQHYMRMEELIRGTPAFASRVKRWARSHSDEAIYLTNGQRLVFRTRTRSGGRGLTGDVVVLDEAMILSDQAISALMPTMAARAKTGNPQLWYTGSAGDEDSVVLARLRRRALAGGDPSLCYLEWSVDEETYRAAPSKVAVDPEQIAIANPSLEIRLTLDHTLREQRSMDPLEYAKERLGVGQWPMLEDESTFLPMDGWAAGKDLSDWRTSGEPVAFALATNFTRTKTSIVAAGADAAGRRFVELVDCRQGVRWAVERLAELRDEWKPCGIAVDQGSPAASLIPDLENAGVDLVKLNTSDAKRACGDFFDLVSERSVHHADAPELTAAAQRADKRDVGDGWLWDLRSTDVDITPLIAATYALHCWTVRHKSGDILQAVW